VRVYLVTPGFEAALGRELGAGAGARTLVPGVVEAATTPAAAEADPVFARQVLPDAALVRGTSVRALAEAAYALTEGIVDAWAGPFTAHMFTAAAIHPDIVAEPGLGARADLVRRAWLELLAARRRRASRRYQPPSPAPDVPGGEDRLLVQLLLLGREGALVSVAAPRRLARGGTDLAPWPAGAAPVAVDRTPPSRAYRKLDEAFAWMGAAPGAGALCVDLGAAPGGWTLTAARRGARVVAVDRAPLAPEVARHPGVASVIGNAFTYQPTEPVDWMLSDVVCEPPRSLELVDAWLERGLCRNLVVTVKFKGREGYGALDAVAGIVDRHRPAFARVKQLVNNKNEVCIMMIARRAQPDAAAPAPVLRDRP
jgi:FtsJ-like methyltransferase